MPPASPAPIKSVEETKTVSPAELAPETKSLPAAGSAAPTPHMDARARMMSTLAAQAMRGPLVVNQFNELKNIQRSQFPPRWPKVIDGREVKGHYKWAGSNGEGLAGDEEVGVVWTPLSREYCALHDELKHITVGFNAEGLYQFKDSIFGYYDVDTYKDYQEALSYNKPQQIMLRSMQDKFEKGPGSVDEPMGGEAANDRNAILLTEFSTGMVDESMAQQLALMGGKGRK